MGQPPVLQLPVRCRMHVDCVVQQYFDHDPGGGATDYRCGPMSYDGHDGVDIRVPALGRGRPDPDVVAAAPGRVEGLRDGVADQDVRLAGVPSVRGHECGNGVLVDHGGGWRTLYCHMARGSVRVRVGQSVATGETLGRIGESGEAAFPHLHFGVLRDGRKVDPFAWDALDTCGRGASLWSPEAARALAYRSPDSLDAGLSPQLARLADIEDGDGPVPVADADAPALVAWVRTIGLAAGDRIRLTLLDPAGRTLADTLEPPLPHARAVELTQVGRRRRGGPWPRGVYAAVVEVSRGGRVALSRRFDLPLARHPAL